MNQTAPPGSHRQEDVTRMGTSLAVPLFVLWQAPGPRSVSAGLHCQVFALHADLSSPGWTGALRSTSSVWSRPLDAR